MKRYTPLIILLVISLLLPVLVIPTSAETVAIPEKLDFADPSSPTKVVLSASELVDLLTDVKVTDLEKRYLDSTLGDVFTYSEFVPQKKVEAVYDFGKLEIKAEKYEYDSPSGKVTFVPTSATIEGKTVSLTYSATSGKYEGKVEGLESSDGETLTVNYSCTLSVSASVANAYVNFTYDKAHELWAEEKKYNDDLNYYNSYQEYLAKLAVYNEKKLAYDKYVEAKEKYDKQVAAFEQYEKDYELYEEEFGKFLKAQEEFETAKKEFEKNKKAYEEYLADLQAYEIELKAYQTYLNELNKFESALAVMESVYKYDINGNQLYGLLTGGTVDYVLATMEENMELLAGTNISESQVRATGKTTAALQKLLEEYAACKTTAEKVIYYSEHYLEISKCFTSLSDSLYYMFHDPTLHGLLYKKDEDHRRFNKFMHMLAQLYVVERGLDDATHIKSDWTVQGAPDLSDPFNKDAYYTHTIYDLLDLAWMPDDKDNSNPTKLGTLPEFMYEPVPPIEVPHPGEQPVNKYDQPPVEPDEVKKPGKEPEAVEDPGKAPDEWLDSIPTMPDPLNHTAIESELVDAVWEGGDALQFRGEVTADKTVEITAEVKKTLVLEDKCIITFYDDDGKTVLYTVTVDKGDKIAYGGEAPTKAETDKGTYSFEGWKNEDGILVTDLGNADEQYIDFYASYSMELKTYTVTWVVNGEETTETYFYGETPAFKGTPTKPDTDRSTYTFSGWTTPIATVTGDARYEAKFAESVRIYVVTWRYRNDTVSESYYYGEIPTYKKSTDKFMDGQYIYEFSGWDKEISTVVGDVIYTATFKKTHIFIEEPDDTDPEETEPVVPPTDDPDDPDEPDDTDPEETEPVDPPVIDPPTVDPPSNVTVEVVDGVYNVKTTYNFAVLNKVLEFADNDDSAVTVNFENLGVKVVMNEAMVGKLASAGCNTLYIYNNEENYGITGAFGSYSVRFENSGGHPVTVGSSVTLRLSLDGKASAATKAYTVTADGASTSPLACTYESGEVTVKLTEGASVVLRNEYKLSAGTVENGVISIDKTVAIAGETVKVSLTYSDAYELLFVKLVGESGNEYTLAEDGSFTMPEENVTVTAELKAKEYTVKFVVDGEVISEQVYRKGETVTVPADPTKEGDGKTVYTFIGWTPAITIVSEDVTYTAEFSTAVIGDDPVVNTDRTRLYTVIALGITAVLLVVVGIPVTVIILVKRRKKKKAKMSENKPEEKSEEKSEE